MVTLRSLVSAEALSTVADVIGRRPDWR